MAVRAKFRCESIAKREDSVDIGLCAVTAGSPENEGFFRWTPSGQLRLNCLNPAAAAQFAEGREYYIDITPADPAA